MPDITITVSDRFIAEVMAATDAYNQQNGTSLTAKQWVRRVLAREMLQPQIATEQDNITRKAHQNARAAAEAKEEELIASL